MILTFYDKNFVALQNNASLNVGIWNLSRKAVDFDDFTAISEGFEEDINPTFVVMKDDRGRYKYAAFAGIPEKEENNQTNIQASDLKTIHNNDVLLNFPEYTTESLLNSMFSYIFQEFYSQVVQESFEIEYDLSDIATLKFDELIPETGYNVYSLWGDILVPYMKYYGIYMTSKLDLENKKIIFTMGRINKYSRFINLYETKNLNYGKWIASVNETQYIIKTPTQLIYGEQYILNSQNQIGSIDKIQRDLYPIKKKLIFKETDYEPGTSDYEKVKMEAMEESLTELINAMYNESLELDVNNAFFTEDSFDSVFEIYINKGNLYKKLPLGEIVEKNDGTKKFILGYKQNDVVLYI